MLFPVVKDDVQMEILKIQRLAFFPCCLIGLVLDKNLIPQEAFLLLQPIINATNPTYYWDGILDLI